MNHTIYVHVWKTVVLVVVRPYNITSRMKEYNACAKTFVLVVRLYNIHKASKTVLHVWETFVHRIMSFEF